MYLKLSNKLQNIKSGCVFFLFLITSKWKRFRIPVAITDNCLFHWDRCRNNHHEWITFRFVQWTNTFSNSWRRFWICAQVDHLHPPAIWYNIKLTFPRCSQNFNGRASQVRLKFSMLFFCFSYQYRFKLFALLCSMSNRLVLYHIIWNLLASNAWTAAS